MNKEERQEKYIFIETKGTVILNSGYMGGRIFYTNSKSFLPHSRNSMKFDTPFQHSKKILYPTIELFSLDILTCTLRHTI